MTYTLQEKQFNLISRFIFGVLYFSLFIDFYFSIDLSGGGSSKDFYQTYPLIKGLSEFNVENWRHHAIHFPLHYFILSFVYKFFENENILRLIYLILVILIPYLTYKNLIKIFPTISKNKLLIFSSFIFLLPFFRSAAVWSNTMTTGLFFYLLSINFFIDFLKDNKNINMIVSIFVLALSVYTVQYFAAFYILFLYLTFKSFGFMRLLQFLSYCVIAALPGLLILHFFPKTMDLPFSKNLSNVLIISFSIISFYFLLLVNLDNLRKLKLNIENFKPKYYLFIFLIFFLLINIYYFNYFSFYSSLGGGAFSKISLLIFSNNLLLYFTCFLGLIFFSALSLGTKENFYVNSTIIIVFLIISFNQIIFQKYYEPMFLLTFIFFSKNEYIEKIFSKYGNIFLSGVFFTVYLIATIIYSTYFSALVPLK